MLGSLVLSSHDGTCAVDINYYCYNYCRVKNEGVIVEGRGEEGPLCDPGSDLLPGGRGEGGRDSERITNTR